MNRPPTNWTDLNANVAGTHFTVGEVLARSGYNQMPRGPMFVGPFPSVTPRIYAATQALAMEELRATINRLRLAHGLHTTGLNVLSWARSWQHNRDVGGAFKSQHLFFRACDIEWNEIQRLCPWKNGHVNFDDTCERLFKSGGFGTYPGGARHVDTRGMRARWSAWTPGG